MMQQHQTKRFLAAILTFALLSFLLGCAYFSSDISATAPREYQRSLRALTEYFDPESQVPQNDKTITVYLAGNYKLNAAHSIFQTHNLELYGSGKFDYIVKKHSRCDESCTRPLLDNAPCIAVATERDCEEKILICNYPQCKTMIVADETCQKHSHDIRNYYGAKQVKGKGYLPLGPRLDSWTSFQKIQSDPNFALKPSSQRQFAFNAVFSKDTNEGRVELAKVIEEQRNETSLPIFTSIANKWERDANSPRTAQLSTDKYMTLVLDSVFTLAPAGHNPQCYRMFEAVEAGSIPVLVKKDTATNYVRDLTTNYKNKCKDPLHHWKDAPILVLDSWNDVFPTMDRIMEDKEKLDEMQTNVIVWYEKYMRKLVGEFEEFMLGSYMNEIAAPRMATAIDPCDDIVLFVPDVNLSIERQLNNYITAAMLATFMNKAMVVLDVPQDLMCPGEEDEKDYPLAFSSIVKSPTWMTRKCPIPCQATHKYSDWDDFRRSDTESPVTLCANDDASSSNVFVVGGDETHIYFEKYFKNVIEGASSSVSYEWAVRAGAKPKEAEVFSKLKGRDMYDYIGALLVRSNVLRLQPQIKVDTNTHIKQFIYRKRHIKVSHDAIHVHRGEDTRADTGAKRYIDNYLEGHEYNNEATQTSTRDYIPLLHYMSQYHDVKCSKSIREIFIATDDPTEVEREITELGPKRGDAVVFNNCHNIHFTVSKVKKMLGESDCAAQYAKTIASISDFIVARTADTFVGEFNSDWGKLIRLFRLVLNEEGGVLSNMGKLGPAHRLVLSQRKSAGADPSPVLSKDTKVAWGPTWPLGLL